MSLDDRHTYPGSGGVLIDAAGILTRQPSIRRSTTSPRSSLPPSKPSRPLIGRDSTTCRASISACSVTSSSGIAGQIRDVDVQGTGTGIPHCRPEYIDANLATLFRKLEPEDSLIGLDAGALAERLADQAGHPIDGPRIGLDALREHRLHAVAGSPLALHLSAHLAPAEQAAAPATSETASQVATRNPGRQDAELLRATGVNVERFLAAGTSLDKLRAAGIDPGPDRTSGPQNQNRRPSARGGAGQPHPRETSRAIEDHER